MFKYLKLYNTHEEYDEYVDSGDFTLPNVTHCIDANDVHYNPLDEIKYQTVDLGLPSGTIWVAQNLGARTPEESGLFYQWADTQGYKDASEKYFDWTDYKYCNGSRDTLTKYNYRNAVLDMSDDAAYAESGGTMKIPSLEQVRELVALPHEEVEGRGVIFTGNNGNTLFLPFTGYLSRGAKANNYAVIITNQTSEFFYNTIFSYWHEGNYDELNNDNGKCYGYTIRPVLV